MGEECTRTLRPTLDRTLARLRGPAVAEAIDALVAELAVARRSTSPDGWAGAIAEARDHALFHRIHLDPFAHRCYAKPRGYAGDGIALDYVLRSREPSAHSHDPLTAMHHRITHGPTGRALGFRRDAIAREVDAAAARGGAPVRVFAAGAGHLRECDRMESLATGRIGRLVAFDADAANLECVRRDYARHPLVTHLGAVRQLVDGRHLFHRMDVVYTAGILETLPKPQARCVMQALFGLLAPGGTFIATHVLRGLQEAAFLEAFMDWRMEYRDEAEMLDLAAGLPQDPLAECTYRENDESTVGVLVLRRR